MTITHHPDARELGVATARRLADDIEAAGGRYVLGCPGGRTPMSTYEALAQIAADRELDLSGLVIAMMDDYVIRGEDGSFRHVDADAHYSCRRFAREEIQRRLNAALPSGHRIPDEHVWFPDPAQPEAYDQRLADAGGIDLFLLASGAGDGHVAFNPPGAAADSRTRIVELALQTRRDNLVTFPQFPGLGSVPTYGVTVGIDTIARLSRSATLQLAGSDKRVAYDRIMSATSYEPGWPATVIHLVQDAEIAATLDAVGVTDDGR